MIPTLPRPPKPIVGFGDSLRSKTDVAMVDETLCKILCHDLMILIHETYELGIDPVFWQKMALQ
jgi:hypothetical protein